MADVNRQFATDGESNPKPRGPAPPELALPKGGGSIQGMGEKFASNPVTGTGSFTLPISTSSGRSGFSPQVAISYSSGSGNSAFGFGWTASLPSITRKTSTGLPQYDDVQNSDIFLLSGAEDLIPVLVQGRGLWSSDPTERSMYGRTYRVQRYRPRVEGIFACIERWDNLSDGTDVCWRSISKENITTWYGLTLESRIADPADAGRIFEWLISRSYDDHGNVIEYSYKPEDSQGVDLTQANERNRTANSRSAQRYIKSVSYANKTPYFPNLTAPVESQLPADWCFQVIFDYGEHDLANPVTGEAQPWVCRGDAFSTYRSTFEVRTYRLCRRVLMFHQFPDLAEVGTDCLVKSFDLVHASSAGADPSQPFYSYLLSASQSGYTRLSGGGYFSKSMPPVNLTYTAAIIDDTAREAGPETLENLPAGIDGKNYRWVDLDGEGLNGILTEQAGAWFYKANLSAANLQGPGPAALTTPRFAPVETVDRLPSLASLSGGQQQLMGLSGDGFPSLVQFARPNPGYFERTADAGWEPFIPFESMPDIDWQNPNLRFIDLTGDGFADVLISEDDAFWWHNSLAIEGFGPAQRVAQSLDEEKGPQLVFADGTESIFLADMSGDGLTDLVRIRVAEICYWPNLGYGRFGPKVTVDGVPRFDRVEQFDARRIRLADIDGSGPADVIYLAGGEVHLYFNQSGNSLAARHVIDYFPNMDSTSTVEVLDLLGSGTACLVWSSPLAGNARSPLRYIDLMSGGKPHLLTSVVNNLGAEVHIQYAPSTRFYVADKLAGTPWITRLPYPVQVVQQVETLDYISRNRFVTCYCYHHGFYDGVEREFRGFGRVDQSDTADLATLTTSSLLPNPANEDAVSNVPPVLTKTWYHTGFFFDGAAISNAMQKEYYAEGDAATDVVGSPGAQLLLLPDTSPPITVLLSDGTRVAYDLSGEEMRQACRALRGSLLRQEIYSLDLTPASDRPYTTSEHNYTIEMLQPMGSNPYGVFLTHARETLDCHYERMLFPVQGGMLAGSGAVPPGATLSADPRVTHSFVLAADAYGGVLQSASVAYGRRFLDPALTPADQLKQQALLCTLNENSYTNAISAPDANRTPGPAESDSFELLQCQPSSSLPNFTNLFSFDELASAVTAASDGHHDVPFEDRAPSGLNPGEPYRRQLSSARTLYRPDDLGQSAGSAAALLPLGSLESLAIAGVSYQLALTKGLIPEVFTRDGTALLPTPADVLESTGPDGGGYVDLDGDGDWWVRSSRVFFSSLAAAPAQELSDARNHFFLPQTFVDPFANASTVGYDAYHLLVTSATDAIGNLTASSNDYRVLAPTLVTDANGNQSAAHFDALGLVAGTAVMGKQGENLGDSFANFTDDLTQSQIDAFYAADDPHTLAAGLLGTATTRILYNLKQYVETSQANPADPTAWQPVFAATLARQVHQSELSPVQINISFSDGFGREIQKKLQAEPGPDSNPRWIASGWTIFNNKGKPVRQYEPFFSTLAVRGHQFEFGVKVGVSPILCYDPLDRVVVTVQPNQTFAKVVFDPWHQQTWDSNDTVLIGDPTSDADVGDYFTRLPASDYSPTWYAQRAGGALGPDEQTAATKGAAHANTPATAYFDTLGRTVLTVADNGVAGKYLTRTELDIQGHQLSVMDALGRQVIANDYDLLGATIHQASMEAGQRWTLNDVASKSIRSWDERGHNRRASYDALRRPFNSYVLGTDATNSDPRTLSAEICYEKIVYGEGQPNAQALNLRTRVYQHFDVSGLSTNMALNPTSGEQEGFDFKGNLLRSSRQFVSDVKALTNWNGASPQLLPAWVGSITWDALNRPTTLTSPDGSVTTPVYNERNALKAVSVNVRSAASATPFVTDIEYNPKGQRLQITYANAGTNTAYLYDSLTYRLTRLTTTRPSSPANQQTVQDLVYTYDPVGNATHIQDNADLQNAVFFQNRRVDPSNIYTYDPVYRLIDATGREQLGLATDPSSLTPGPASWNDIPRAGRVQPGDGRAMGIYEEQYKYDAVGNLLSYIHRGSDPANPGWSRTYSYAEASLLNAAQISNRLSSSAISGTQPLLEKYTYDPHGNMTSMPQLQGLQWDFSDQLQMSQTQAVNASSGAQQTFYVYNAAGVRVRKATLSSAGVLLKQRFYIGDFELYQEFDSANEVNLERQTLQVMDDKQRIALIEITTVDASAVQTSLPSTTTRYQFANHLGSASLVLDDQGSVISYEEYYPYGSTSYQAGATTVQVSLKRYRYTGKERDEESGFYYHGARYYAPWLARWTSADATESGDGYNLYAYVKNNPITYSDPTGHYSFSDFGSDVWGGIKGAVKGIAEPALIVADFGQMGAALVTHEFFPSHYHDVQWLSGTGKRIEGGTSGWRAGLVVATAIPTGGGSVLADNISTVFEKDMTPEQARSFLVQGAVAQVFSVAVGSGTSKATGSGWTGRGPTASPAGDAAILNNLTDARVAAGDASREGVFAQGRGPWGKLTSVAESDPQEGGLHAEAKVKAQLPAYGGRSYGVDQIPCEGSCWPDLANVPKPEQPGFFDADVFGSRRVFVLRDPAKLSGSPKTAAIKAAAGKINPVPDEIIRVPFAPPVVQYQSKPSDTFFDPTPAEVRAQQSLPADRRYR